MIPFIESMLFKYMILILNKKTLVCDHHSDVKLMYTML